MSGALCAQVLGVRARHRQAGCRMCWPLPRARARLHGAVGDHKLPRLRLAGGVDERDAGLAVRGGRACACVRVRVRIVCCLPCSLGCARSRRCMHAALRVRGRSARLNQGGGPAQPRGCARAPAAAHAGAHTTAAQPRTCFRLDDGDAAAGGRGRGRGGGHGLVQGAPGLLVLVVLVPRQACMAGQQEGSRVGSARAGGGSRAAAARGPWRAQACGWRWPPCSRTRCRRSVEAEGEQREEQGQGGGGAHGEGAGGGQGAALLLCGRCSGAWGGVWDGSTAHSITALARGGCPCLPAARAPSHWPDHAAWCAAGAHALLLLLLGRAAELCSRPRAHASTRTHTLQRWS